MVSLFHVALHPQFSWNDKKAIVVNSETMQIVDGLDGTLSWEDARNVATSKTIECYALAAFLVKGSEVSR